MGLGRVSPTGNAAGGRAANEVEDALELTRVGLTFDTGALIGLERSHHAMRKVYDTAITNDVTITVPSVVVAEWWRSGKKEKWRAKLLRSVVVEPIGDFVARLAGVALTLVRDAQTIDAIVMASAALRGDDIVYTSDFDDLLALRDGVPELRAVRVERA